MSNDSDHLLSELSDSAFDLPALEFEDDDVDLDEALVPALTKQKRDILIEVNENCKKVITLDEDQQDLKILFRVALCKDPTLRQYSQQSVTLQTFNEKFNTWVDLDNNDIPKLSDGTHLKAVFGNDKSIKNSRHRRKDREKASSHDHRKKKKRKRHSSRDSSNDEFQISKYRRSRKSYSSDEGRKRSIDHKQKRKKRNREKLRYKRRKASSSSSSDTEMHSSKRSRASYSSDESLVTTTATDKSNTISHRSFNRHHKAHKDYSSMQYNLCAVTSTTMTVSNYVVSKYNNPLKQDTIGENCQTEEIVEEGEMTVEAETGSSEIIPASQGKLYRLSLGLRGKNPISALHELGTKLRCAPPSFEVLEDGYMPDPQFLMQVTFQGKTYIPNLYATKKKDAKRDAAECCLKHLGIIE